MARTWMRIAFVVLAMAGSGRLGSGEPPRLDPDAERDYRAWGAGQLLAQRAGLPAVPLASPEARGGVDATAAITRLLGLALPTPAPADLVDVRARARWLLRGEGRATVTAIEKKLGERAGALAGLATVIPVLSVAWPTDAAPTGTPLWDELFRFRRRAPLPSRLLAKTFDLQGRRPAASEVSTATLEAMQGVSEYLYWEAIGPTDADIHAVAWDLGTLLGRLELAVVNAPVGEEDRARLTANCARLGVEPPRLPPGRIQGDAALRAHLVYLRVEYADPAYQRIEKRLGAAAADWLRMGWRLALPSMFDLGVSRPPEVRAKEIEDVSTRLKIPPAAWMPLVAALRTKQPKQVVTARAAEMARDVGAHLEAGVERRGTAAPSPPALDPAQARSDLFRVGVGLATAILGIAARPEHADAWVRLSGAVDAADAVALPLPAPPARRGDPAADVEAATAWLRRGPGEDLAVRIEGRAGATGRAYFDVGLRSELLRAFYEPGSERTARITAALEDGLRRVDASRDAWGPVLAAVKAGAAAEKVKRDLGFVQAEYLGKPLLTDEPMDFEDEGGR